MASEDLTNLTEETAKVEPEGIRIGGTILKMKCPRGHEWTEESSLDRPFHLTLIGQTSADTNGVISTGPLCALCMVDFLNYRCGAEIISATPKYPIK